MPFPVRYAKDLNVSSVQLIITNVMRRRQDVPSFSPRVIRGMDCRHARYKTEGFDTGSERTLTEWIRHASRTSELFGVS